MRDEMRITEDADYGGACPMKITAIKTFIPASAPI